MRRRTFRGLLALLTAFVVVTPSAGMASEVIVVSPSGDTTGATDWANIMDALGDAIAAGPGAIVEFAKGDFYFHRPIQAANFSGTLRGQGKGATRLHTAPGVPFALPVAPEVPAGAFMSLYFDETWPTAQTAQITISGMTFNIDGPSEPWSGHGAPVSHSMAVVLVRGIMTGVADFQPTNMDVVFEDLEAIGVEGPVYAPYQYSIASTFSTIGEVISEVDPVTGSLLLRWWKPLRGNFVFRDLVQKNANDGMGVVWPEQATITFGGKHQDSIYSTNVNQTSIALLNVSDSQVEVSGLEAQDAGGIFVFQGQIAVWGNDLGVLVPESMPGPSAFQFHNNTIAPKAGAEYGVFELWDIPGEIGIHTADVAITNNKIVSVDPLPPYAAIFSHAVDGAVVTNNKITGQGVAAIWIGPFGTQDSDLLLLGNNLQGYDAEFASTYLGPATSGNTIVGGNNMATVFDEGSGNLLVGVNNMGGNPPGSDIVEGMQRKRDLISSMR